MQKKSKLTVFTFMMLIILALTFQPAISTYAAYPEDLISYWKLNETAGPDYEDSFGDNNGAGGSATGAGDPAPITGQVKGAQEFNGTNTEINVPADNSFDWQADESFSIEFWMKTDGTPPPLVNGTQVIIGRKDASTPSGWWVGIDGTNGKISFNLIDTDGNGGAGDLDGVGTADPTNGSWHHVVAVTESDGITRTNSIYVDGLLQGNAPSDSTAGFGSTADLTIGHFEFGLGFYFDGLVDEVALYDRALGQEEIEQHYDSGLLGRGIDTQAAEIIRAWDNGIRYWDTDASPPPWTQMTADVTTADIAAGDFNGDGIADVASSWGDLGLWWQDGTSSGDAGWTKLDPNPAYSLAAGDVTGDGRDELIGTWDQGIYYYDFVATTWTQMTADVTTADIAAGDFNGDGIADVASSWGDLGLWWQDGAIPGDAGWTKIDPNPAYSLAAGDVTGDGRDELIGTWDQGIYYYDFVATTWTQMTADVTTADIAAGDFNGDGIADVASSWGDLGLWWQDGTSSGDAGWTKIDPNPAYSLAAGDLTGQ